MRPRVLFLSQCLPHPPHAGVTSRTFNILRQLQRRFDVSLVTFSRRNHQASAEAREQAARALRDVVSDVMEPVPIRGSWSATARLWNHARAVCLQRPYTYFEYEASAFGHRIDQAITAARPQLVHVDSLDLYRWVDRDFGVPVACTHHSVESDLLRGRGRRLRSPMLRAYVRYQAQLMERVEAAMCPRFAVNVMMSTQDGAKLRQIAPTANTTVVPNGVDTGFFRPDGRPIIPGRIVFIGPTYMFPNRDAVDFFLTEIWPKIRSGASGSTVHVIGKSPAGDVARFRQFPGVVVRGYVDDIRPAVAEAECSIVPIRVGGGTRLKILDSWALGKAVVSTSIGCEGLDAVDGENILIRDDPEGFARAVVDVLSTPALRQHLGANARRTAEDVYSWDVIGEHLANEYEQLLATSADA